jgi:hypothetical protein
MQCTKTIETLSFFLYLACIITLSSPSPPVFAGTKHTDILTIFLCHFLPFLISASTPHRLWKNRSIHNFFLWLYWFITAVSIRHFSSSSPCFWVIFGSLNTGLCYLLFKLVQDLLSLYLASSSVFCVYFLNLAFIWGNSLDLNVLCFLNYQRVLNLSCHVSFIFSLWTFFVY